MCFTLLLLQAISARSKAWSGSGSSSAQSRSRPRAAHRALQTGPAGRRASDPPPNSRTALDPNLLKQFRLNCDPKSCMFVSGLGCTNSVFPGARDLGRVSRRAQRAPALVESNRGASQGWMPLKIWSCHFIYLCRFVYAQIYTTSPETSTHTDTTALGSAFSKEPRRIQGEMGAELKFISVLPLA